MQVRPASPMTEVDHPIAVKSAQDVFEEAMRSYQRGDMAEAARLIGNVLTIDPAHSASILLLGLIAARGGRYDLAVELIGRATGLRPDHPEYHYEIAVAFHREGRPQWAITHYGRALALDPLCARAHNNLGRILHDQGQFDAAASHFGKALSIQPDCAEFHYNVGIALAAQNNIDEAVIHYHRAIALKPDYADAHHNLASALETAGKPDEALAHYQRALALHPGHAEAHNNSGNILKEHGRFKEALAHYDRSLAIQPGFAQAHYNRAEIRTFVPGDPDLAVLEALADDSKTPPVTALHVHFALAKALEDTGNFARSFEHLRIANGLKRDLVRYDEARIDDLFRDIARIFDRELLEGLHGAGDPSSVPVFILGMPRSGSSLIEQILASHPQIQGGGERTDLEAAAATVLSSNDKGVKYPACIPTLSNVTIRRLGAAYISRLPAQSADILRITDKLPGNFLHIGLIRAILPNARIIHTMRDPLDTCISCYSKLFSSGVNFSYDLGELGRYYRRYRELMNHWRSVLAPDAILDVSYEDVVDDLEGEARRMIDYCGLPWDDRCLSFHTSKRRVATASSVQVRKPLFGSSRQRWRRYQDGLDPLFAGLGISRPASAALAAAS
ncbi:MAG TPA: sulfotransferase [Bryobacteraceae bacterium]|nr:sulfotransferase [Bryobacteraceae bacterium]